MSPTTRDRASAQRTSIGASVMGHARSLARGAGRAIAQVAFRGQLGPIGCDWEDRPDWHR